MIYSYCINTFDECSNPIQKGGIINVPDEFQDEDEIVEYLISKGAINQTGYEVLELMEVKI